MATDYLDAARKVLQRGGTTTQAPAVSRAQSIVRNDSKVTLPSFVQPVVKAVATPLFGPAFASIASKSIETALGNVPLTRKIATEIPGAAVSAAKTWLDQDRVKRESMTLGEQAMQDLVERPAKILKAVSVDLPRAIVGGFTSIGRTLMEEVDTKLFGKPSEESRKSMASPELDKILYGFEAKSWQQTKDEIDSYTAKSPIASDWERKHLGLTLALIGFTADSWVGGPGKPIKTLSTQVLKKLALEQDQALIRNVLVHEGVPVEVADAARFAIAEAKTPEAVDMALRRSVQGMLNIAEEAAKKSPAQPVAKASVDTPSPTKAPIPATAEEASDRYWREALEPSKKEGEMTVIGSDNLKYHFNDFDIKNHPVYSKAANDTLMRAARESKSPRVIFTAGGPGSGKSEVITRFLKTQGDGVIYDSNLSNAEGALRQIEELERMGKQPEIVWIVRDPESAFRFAQAREASGGHPVTETAFARNHANLPTVMETLLNNGKTVRAIDVQGLNDLTQYEFLEYSPDVASLIKSTRRTEDDIIKAVHGIRSETKGRASPVEVEGGPVPRRSETGGDKKPTKDERGGNIRALQKEARREVRKVAPIAKKPAKAPDSETASLDLLAQEERAIREYEYKTHGSPMREDAVVADLEQTFAALKGVEVADLKTSFTKTDLEGLKQEYSFLSEFLLDHPGRGLLRFRSTKEGQFMGKKDPRMAKTDAERVAIEKRNEALGRALERMTEGKDDMYLSREDPNFVEEQIEDYIRMRDKVKDVLENIRSVRKSIQLAKQADEFVGNAKNAIAREAAKGAKEMHALVLAAERAGYRRGVSAARGKYDTLVMRLKSRRDKLRLVQSNFNLTNKEMQKVRGTQDPRFLTDKEFDTYMEGVLAKAEEVRRLSEERMLVENLILDNELKKTENLQKAMELPPLEKMKLEQIREFYDALSETPAHSTFLSPRMIQTVKNTDLGDFKTVEQGIEAVVKQTGMEPTEVYGKKLDRWLRDPTLYERDPIHRVVIGEWAAREAEMLTKKAYLRRELNRLFLDARKSARIRDAGLRAKRLLPTQGPIAKLLDKIAPQDRLMVRWLQPFEYTYIEKPGGGFRVQIIENPAIREQAESLMTAQELKAARFAEKFFGHYYSIAQQKSLERWTLQGVKHSKYKDMYLPHITPGFFEQWRNLREADRIRKATPGKFPEGKAPWVPAFMRSVGKLWAKNVDDKKVDWTAFGDRGEVLGMEKWLNRAMVREGPGEDKLTGQLFYSQNVAKAMLSYYDAFEKKLIIDALIPKIKLLQLLFGKRFQTPKSINNPDGAEKIHGELVKHWNEWANNKKGQKIEMMFAQGDSAEAAMNATRQFISVIQLGINIPAQLISGLGGEAAYLAGAGVKGWAIGHRRAAGSKGKQLAKDYAGVVGEAPWRELGDSAMDAGETILGATFYLFGDFNYRARRQLFLSKLTKEEYQTGIISPKRQGELRIEMGKWLPDPSHRSIAGETAAVKAATMYTEWAAPMLENVYITLLPKLRSMITRDPASWATTVKTPEFQALLRTVLVSAGLVGTAYWLLNPDKNDQSVAGYMRRKAAQEIGTVVQALTLFGVPTPGSVFISYFDGLRKAIQTLLSLEKYETSGPGYKEGDLKGPNMIANKLVPRGIAQWLPEPETPIKTEEDVRREVKAGIESGDFTPSAAKEYAKNEIRKIREAEKKRRFEMEEDEYREDLKKRAKDGEITMEDAKAEVYEYLQQKKKKDPESFESDSEASFIDKVKVYAEAVGTDPITAFGMLFQGETIRRTDNGAIIVARLPYEESQEIRKERGATKDLILDHTLPLQLGGDNSESNLKLVPVEEWERFTPIENYLGIALRNGEVSKKKAQQLIRDFKEGKIDEEDVYAAF